MTSELPISLEELVVAVLLADAPLIDYFASRGRSLEEALFHPMRVLDDSDSADVLGPETATPFLILQPSGETGILPILSTFNLEMFDTTDNGYNELTKIAKLVWAALDRKMLGSTESNYHQWFRVDAIYTSPKQTDPEYVCDMMFVRYQVYGA